jgi:hypothetical protein
MEVEKNTEMDGFQLFGGSGRQPQMPSASMIPRSLLQ